MTDANLIVLSGRLGRDPERGERGPLRLSVAIESRWQDADGEWQSRTTWVPVVAWPPLSDRIESRLTKGDCVLVEGRLVENAWADKQTGEERRQLQVVASNVRRLGPARGSNDEPRSAPRPAGRSSAGPPRDIPPPTDDDFVEVF